MEKKIKEYLTGCEQSSILCDSERYRVEEMYCLLGAQII